MRVIATASPALTCAASALLVQVGRRHDAGRGDGGERRAEEKFVGLVEQQLYRTCGAQVPAEVKRRVFSEASRWIWLEPPESKRRKLQTCEPR